MKRCLITGGAGFIGSNFIHYLLENRNDICVTNLDALTYAGNLDNLKSLENNPNYEFLHIDICDNDSLISLFNNSHFDSVVHFAAESHVDRSIANPLTFIQTNVVGTANLLRVCQNYWQGMDNFKKERFKFLHISTDEVFGSLEKDGAPFTESTPYSPNSPYAASKAASDHLVRAYFNTYNFPTIITNCTNNYGPYQFPEKLIPLVILNALNGKSLPVYGDGGQIRDWLYVEDHCAALLDVLEKGLPGQTYNIGGDNQPTNLEVIGEICSILDELLPDSVYYPHSQLIKFVNDRPGHDRRYAINFEKIKDDLGWIPKIDLNEGLRKTIEWYMNNQNWVKSVLEKPNYTEWVQTNYLNRKEVK